MRPLGTHERFIGVLIEHYADNFPLWLAPDQVRVITLNDDEALIAYAKPQSGGARLLTSWLAGTLAPPAAAIWKPVR